MPEDTGLIPNYYDTPEIKQALSDYQGAVSTTSDFQTAAATLPSKLQQAINEKLDYNKDLIAAKNKSMADYFAAPSASREKYANIFDPFAREKLVAQDRANAYSTYATDADILSARMGNIQDIINTAVGAYNSQIQASQNKASQLETALNFLLQMAGVKEKKKQWEYEQTHKSGSDVSGLEGLLELLTRNASTAPQPTEEKPTRIPPDNKRIWTSPEGQWIWDSESQDWVPVID